MRCIHVLQCDVSNLDEVRTLRERIRKDLGNVDILVNSAAISSKETLIDVPPGEIVRMFKVNLLSQIWVRKMVEILCIPRSIREQWNRVKEPLDS